MILSSTSRPAVGSVLPQRQHHRRASPAALRFWARSIGDMNPRHVDESYVSVSSGPAFAAHPCWLASVHDGVELVGPGGTYPLLARAHWTFVRPVVPGESIHAVSWLTGHETRASSLCGDAAVSTVLVEFSGAQRDLLATARTTLVHVDPDRARSSGKYDGWKRTRYTDEQFTEIEAAYDGERPRGGEPLYADDVAVGDAIPRMVRGPLTSEEIVLFVGATRPVPSAELFATELDAGRALGFVHPVSGLVESTAACLVDDESARALGLPAAHDMGPDRIGQCATAVTNWMGDLGILRELDVRLVAPHMLGDTAWFEASVRETGPTTDRAGTVSLALTVTNQRAEVTATGRAVVDLPRRRLRPVERGPA